MKKLKNRSLHENFYKIVANNLETEVKSKKILAYESRSPLSVLSYLYDDQEDCMSDFNELEKYKKA